MLNKIFKWVRWIGFPLGITAIAFVLVFVFNWGKHVEVGQDDAADKRNKVNYKYANLLNEDTATKAILEEFLSIEPTVEGITKAIGQGNEIGTFKRKLDGYTAIAHTELDFQKENAKNYFSYLNTLKKQNRENFEKFKSEYPYNLATFLQDGALKFDPNAGDKNKDLISQFKKNVTDYESLQSYIINDLNPAYTEYKKEQIVIEERLKALDTLKANIDKIYEMDFIQVKPGTKDKVKIETTKELQDQFKTYISMTTSLSLGIVFCYILFILAMGSVVIFIFINIIKTFKTSYKGLLGLLIIIAIAFIAFAVAKTDITNEVFLKQNITPFEGRLIEAACYLTYVVIAAAILSLIVAPILSRVLSNKSKKATTSKTIEK